MVEEFLEDIEDGVASFGRLGSSLLANALSAEIFETMDPRASLEPLVFACFKARSIERDLPQIIFRYLPGDLRPEKFPVRSSSGGAVCVPLLADFLTSRQNEMLFLACRGDEFWLSDDVGRDVSFDREACLPFQKIRIPVRCHPLTEALYATDPDCCRQSTSAAVSNRQALIHALNTLQIVLPEYWAALTACTKEIVIFSDPAKNSFAALSSYGTAFINVLGDKNATPFFLEDIIHQCGHIMFSAIDFKRKKFLSENPDTPLREKTDVKLEHRTLHTALHGLFTEALIVSLLDRYLSESFDDPLEAFESMGRLAFIMNKFGHDLQYMSNREFYTPRGVRLIECFHSIYHSILSSRASEFRAISLGRQQYTFDATAFFEANPAVQ
jgi:hypothetical protein